MAATDGEETVDTFTGILSHIVSLHSKIRKADKGPNRRDLVRAVMRIIASLRAFHWTRTAIEELHTALHNDADLQRELKRRFNLNASHAECKSLFAQIDWRGCGVLTFLDVLTFIVQLLSLNRTRVNAKVRTVHLRCFTEIVAPCTAIARTHYTKPVPQTHMPAHSFPCLLVSVLLKGS